MAVDHVMNDGSLEHHRRVASVLDAMAPVLESDDGFEWVKLAEAAVNALHAREPAGIAATALDRLCAYDAVDARGGYGPTADRISAFLSAFVQLAAERLVAVAVLEEATPTREEPTRPARITE